MSVRPQSDPPREHMDHAHQADQTAARGITIGVIALLLFLGLLQWFIVWLVNVLSGSQSANQAAPMQVEHPSVVHWTTLSADLHELRQRSYVLLHSTEWVDSNRRVARIPIEEAMDMIVRGGSPYPAPEARAPEARHQRQEENSR